MERTENQEENSQYLDASVERSTSPRFCDNLGELSKDCVFRNIPVGYTIHKIVFDEIDQPLDYIFIEVNDAFQKLTGLERNHVIGRRVSEVIRGAQESAFDWMEIFKRVSLTTEKVQFEQYLDLLGIWCSVLAYSPKRDTLITLFNDVTKEKQAYIALKRSEASLAEAQRIAHLGNWDWDIINNELHWSDEVYNIFGISQPQDFSGTYDAFLEFVHPNDREHVKASVDRAITEMEPYSMDHRIIRPDGSERIVHEQSAAIYDDDGAAIQMIGTVLDMTEIRNTEKQLQIASNRAKLFLDLLAHDVSNHLQIILSCNQLLASQSKTVENDYLIEIITESVNECERIVSKVRSTEHLTEAPMVLMDLRTATIDCINSLCEEYDNLIVKFEYTNDEALILADDFLECLLDNLLWNAIQHNPSLEKRLWIKIQQKNHGYEVSVADNGPGINDQIKKDLFDATRRFGGVGLHQVKEILEKHRGTVEVCDRVSKRPECGVEFRLWFPKAAHKQVSRNAGMKEKREPNKGES